MKHRMSAVSLFSGSGGLDLGLSRSGFEFVLANELDPIIAESHHSNFPSVPMFVGSVSELSTREFARLAPSALRGLSLVAGGPPCPPFSKSRFYRKDKPRALEDPIGWETVTGFLDVLDATRPQAFLLENVPGLAYNVHQEALNYILDRARGLGYQVDWKILNAADFGVPQIRQRLFIVGLVDRRFRWPEATHAEDPEAGLFTQQLSPWVTAGEAIADLDTDENGNDEGHFAGGKHHDLLRKVPPGENYLHFTAERGFPEPIFEWRSRYWSFLLKLAKDKPSWTIQAKRSNNMGPFHWRNRILRIPEVRRLQTFPDDWITTGSVEMQWRELGNAVPPLLAQRLGEAIRDSLNDAEAGVRTFGGQTAAVRI
jgi:DNA (cytosine-5)-methyltransferase 1